MDYRHLERIDEAKRRKQREETSMQNLRDEAISLRRKIEKHEDEYGYNATVDMAEYLFGVKK